MHVAADTIKTFLSANSVCTTTYLQAGALSGLREAALVCADQVGSLSLGDGAARSDLQQSTNKHSGNNQ